eukprot:TRINITY_DN42930_c0_g1_i1.p1 TRINITY_DN42930_c0_g1~~TRINITY_DN42930_c0_g1_i1.p1  ORF type:complete len:214 (+),score=24.26 TRINITY_DN42930_c0_g1_i1:57-698(+)
MRRWCLIPSLSFIHFAVGTRRDDVNQPNETEISQSTQDVDESSAQTPATWSEEGVARSLLQSAGVSRVDIAANSSSLSGSGAPGMWFYDRATAKNKKESIVIDAACHTDIFKAPQCVYFKGYPHFDKCGRLTEMSSVTSMKVPESCVRFAYVQVDENDNEDEPADMVCCNSAKDCCIPSVKYWTSMGVGVFVCVTISLCAMYLCLRMVNERPG